LGGSGKALAVLNGMGAKTLQELRAYSAARKFKLDVYKLIERSDGCRGDARFCGQLRSAASSAEANVAEGFGRYTHGDFRRFLSIARGSLVEATTHLQDGVDRGYFLQSDANTVMDAGRQAAAICTALWRSLDR
jgi:four helix bundle protein